MPQARVRATPAARAPDARGPVVVPRRHDGPRPSALPLALLLALSPGLARADEPAAGLDERRVAWGGLVGGSLTPSELRALEVQLLEVLGRDERILLVDAGGRPLGAVARAKEVERVRRLLRGGIDLVLRGRHEDGRGRIDQAVALFEATLGAHTDHDVLHDALLAQSESLFARGQQEAARTTLERLRALSPRLVPEEPRGLVALWEAVVRSKPRAARLEVEAGEGASIVLDGRALGPAPVALPKVGVGPHLLGVVWHDLTVSQAIQVTPGRTNLVSIQRPALVERAQDELAEAISTRLGPATVTGAIPRLVTMSGATEVVVAVVRPGGQVFLARHGADGLLRRIVGGVLGDARPGTPEVDALAERLAATVLLERPLGGFRLGPEREATSWVGAAAEAYGGAAPAPPVALAGLGEGPREAWEAPPPEAPEEAPSLLGRPWFWVLVGVAVAGGVAGGILLAQPAPETTLVRVVLPSNRGLHAGGLHAGGEP